MPRFTCGRFKPVGGTPPTGWFRIYFPGGLIDIPKNPFTTDGRLWSLTLGKKGWYWGWW